MSRVSARFLNVSVVATSLALGATLSASGPVTWLTATAAEFLAGQTVGTAIDDAGRVTLGPSVTDLADAAAPQVWSLAANADGTWVAGTGGDGRLLISRNGSVTTLFDAPEAQIYAVALAADGRVFAASSPDGKVYVIDAAGQSRVFADPVEKYIWGLALDGANRLWIAAGTPAVLYRAAADGTLTAVAKPAAAHIVSLAIDAQGRVVFGTEGPGRVYRVANDVTTALADTGLAEVRALTTTADGAIWASALAADGTPDGPGSTAGLAATSAPGATPPSPPKSTIFRIAADGAVAPAWESADTVYDLLSTTEGVLAAAGPDGHMYQLRLGETGVTSTLTGGVDARFITRLARAGARTIAATANPGRIAALGAPSSTGTYLSSIRDARTTARWGTIRWDATGTVTLETRSGNTSTPDESWSAWAGATGPATGATIASPAARYLQWRATLSGDATAALTSVTVGYLPANSRPVVGAITVYPSGTVFQKPFADDGAIAGLDDDLSERRRAAQADGPLPAPSLGRKLFQKGLQTLAWKAEDADGDRISYALAYRREGETAWQTFRTGLIEPLAVWDTSTVPDGRYALRVTASDVLSNTADRALTGMRDSGTIDVDNTAPEILVAPAAGASNVISVTVRDAASSIDTLEWAVGGGAWVALVPADGVADSREERYTLTVPAGVDPARVMLRASDVFQNVTVVRARR